MAERTRSIDLSPGTRMCHKTTGTVLTLAARKSTDDGRSRTMPWWPGWWNTDGSGLADFVIDADDSEWEVVDG